MTSGKLYVVATPIGNLADITVRAKQILQQVSLIAAEDTRHSQKLLQHLVINTPLISLHQHNEKQRIANVLKKIREGAEVALISDAGTPLISDPGQQLVAAVREAGLPVLTIPGPCALIAALSAAGLPADEFYFAGFLATKSGARQQQLQQLATMTCTLIFYEAPHRILDLVADMIKIFGADRYAVVTRELTKLHETSYGASLEAINEWLQKNADQQKGEFVI